MANNRVCLLCGTEYSYCPTCAADKRKPSWMSAYDKEDCKTIFETLSAYGMKLMTVSDAKNAIKNINVDLMKLDSQKKETIKEILGNKSTVVETPVVKVAETPAPMVADIKPTVKPEVKPVEVAKKEVVKNVGGNVNIPEKKVNNNFKEGISE